MTAKVTPVSPNVRPMGQGGVNPKPSNFLAAENDAINADSLLRAIEYQNETCPRSRDHNGNLIKYTMYELNDKVFASYGLATVLYFQMCRRLCYLFLFLSICALPALIFNYSGIDYYYDENSSSSNGVTANVESKYEFDAFSLGHLQQTQRNSTVTILGKYSKPKVGLIMTLCDVIATIAIVLFIIQLQNSLKNVKTEYENTVVTISNYSVAVTNLPPKFNDRNSLRQFFTQFGRVVDTSLIFNNYELVQIYTKRGILKQEIHAMKHLNTETAKNRIIELSKDIIDLDSDIRLFVATREIKCVGAVVMFEDKNTVKKVLNEYPHTFFKRLCMPKRFKFQNKKLILRQASEPSNLLWHHLSYSNCNKRCRRVFTFAVTIIFFFITTALCYISMFYQQQLPKTNAYDCANVQISNYNNNLNEQESYCFCSNLSTSELITYHTVCYEFIQRNAIRQLLVFLTSITTVVINQVIVRVIRLLSSYEKHTSRGSQLRGMSKKLSAGLIVNTGIIILLVNANFNGILSIEITNRLPSYLLKGSYSDFTADFFQVVGTSLTFTLLIGSIDVPVVETLRFLVHQLKIICLSPSAATQSKLNSYYTGREFRIGERYAKIICCIFIILIYNTGIPLMNLIGFLTCF